MNDINITADSLIIENSSQGVTSFDIFMVLLALSFVMFLVLSRFIEVIKVLKKS